MSRKREIRRLRAELEDANRRAVLLGDVALAAIAAGSNMESMLKVAFESLTAANVARADAARSDREAHLLAVALAGGDIDDHPIGGPE